MSRKYKDFSSSFFFFFCYVFSATLQKVQFLIYKLGLKISELVRLNLLTVFKVLSSVQKVHGGGLFIFLP